VVAVADFGHDDAVARAGAMDRAGVGVSVRLATVAVFEGG
jgi:hypothetical protein